MDLEINAADRFAEFAGGGWGGGREIGGGEREERDGEMGIAGGRAAGVA